MGRVADQEQYSRFANLKALDVASDVGGGEASIVMGPRLRLYYFPQLVHLLVLEDLSEMFQGQCQ